MAEVKEAKVPDIGNYTSVPVIELLVKPGDSVSKDQGLITLESDKATMEVPAPFAGVVKELKVKLGDAVSEGSVVALIESAAVAPATAAKPVNISKPSAAPVTSPIQASPLKKEREQPMVANMPPPKLEENRSSVDPEVAGPRTPPVTFGADAILPDKVPYASPAIRLFARELGVDLARVKGSERKGRITRQDVQLFVKQALAGGAAARTGGGMDLNLLPWPQIDFSKFGEVESRPLSRIRKIAGANLARNWVMIPHVTQHDEADITEMEAFRKKLGAENQGVKVTPLVFLIKAVVAALKKFPHFNASLDISGEQLIIKKYFHVGIAVDTPEGLVVPVIRDCDRKGVLELAQALADISAKARDKKLGPADMSGGCFSISSLGGIGGTAFTPIINAPEVAILGVSKSQTKPVWQGKEFAPRLMLPLSLSYDHRVIDGADAARFVAYIVQTLGDIRQLLL